MGTFVAGCAAGIAEVLVGHPFDTVKAKIQTQRQAGSEAGEGGSDGEKAPLVRYRGPVHCFIHIVSAEGVAGLYAGVAAPLVQKALGISFLFGTMAWLKGALGADLWTSPARFVLACLVMGFLESVIYCPLDLLKTRAQVVQRVKRGGGGGVTSEAQAVWRAHGVAGLYKGWGLQVVKEQVGNVALFGAYEVASGLLQSWLNIPHDHWMASLPAGSAAGVAYQSAGYPFETVKNVLQTQPLGGGEGQKGGLRAASNPCDMHESTECLQGLLDEGGWARLFQGITMSVARAVPGAGAQFLAYETVRTALERWA